MKTSILGYQGADLAIGYAKLRDYLRAFGESYIAQYPGQVARACHAVSHGFFETWQSHPLSESFPLAVTIGNVYHKGCNLYQVTRESIAQILTDGFRPEKSVDFHVWLTLDDMTVIDLTIVSSLAVDGVLSSDTPQCLCGARPTKATSGSSLYSRTTSFSRRSTRD